MATLTFISIALGTKEKALSEAHTERAKLVAVVQTLQKGTSREVGTTCNALTVRKEFAKIFIPAWRASVNPSQLSNRPSP